MPYLANRQPTPIPPRKTGKTTKKGITLAIALFACGALVFYCVSTMVA